MKGISTFRIVITALFSALICVATMLIQIPIPATGGYANPGDAVILICAFLMNPVYAVIAAGTGSLLADLLAGYAAYAPGTLAIKAGVALIAAMIYRFAGKNVSGGRRIAAMAVSGIIAEIFMVLGYFLYEYALLGLGAAAAGGLIGNMGQGIAGVVISCAIAPVLIRSPEIRELMRRS